jgi:dsRNA-specific ribonuclease
MAYTPKEFKQHITSLLDLGGMQNEVISTFLTEETVKRFQEAYTHKSIDDIHNYEQWELLGDGNIGEFMPYYIKERWPYITTPKWLTRIKHNLVSGKMLAKLAMKAGIERYVRVSDILPQKKNALRTFNKSYVIQLLATQKFEDVWKDPAVFSYMSILEDVMEAFCGALVYSVQKAGYSHGLGVQIVHNILHSFFDKEQISIDYRDVFDAVTRLKELYESKALGYRWPFAQTYKIDKDEATEIFTVHVFGWPTGDKTAVPQNRIMLATASGPDKDRTKEEASKIALDVLEKKYGIKERIADPREQ